MSRGAGSLLPQGPLERLPLLRRRAIRPQLKRAHGRATPTLAPGCAILGPRVSCHRHHLRGARQSGCVQSDANDLAARRWAISGAAFAAHIAYEQVRLRSSPGATALHASLAVALGAFALAVAANVHAQAAASHQPSHFLALVLWPVVTALPAFVVGLAAAAGLGLARARGDRSEGRG